MSNDILMIHPEFAQLQKEINLIKSDLTSLLFERDELEFHICKNIEAEYMLKIGALEYKALEFEYKVLRLKRKIELVQIKLNREETADVALIENQLDKEYVIFKNKLEKQKEEIKSAIKRNRAEALTEADNAEMKRIYKQIMRQLHPDLNPNCTEEQKTLFMDAVYSYENSDLNTLKTICLLLADIAPHIEKKAALNELREQKKKLLEQKERIWESIEMIKDIFPYNQINFLKSEEEIKARKAELNQSLEDYRSVFFLYEQKLTAMLGSMTCLI